MLKLFMDFVDNYVGPPLAIIVLGGGASLSRLATVPGSSRVLDGLALSWSKESSLELLWNIPTSGENFKFVSKEVVQCLKTEITDGISPLDCQPVAISAALTTNRYRKGDNHAYVAFSDSVWHLHLPKFDENQYKEKGSMSLVAVREWEDMIITMFVLKHLYPDLDWNMPDNVVVKRV